MKKIQAIRANAQDIYMLIVDDTFLMFMNVNKQ